MYIELTKGSGRKVTVKIREILYTACRDDYCKKLLCEYKEIGNLTTSRSELCREVTRLECCVFGYNHNDIEGLYSMCVVESEETIKKMISNQNLFSLNKSKPEGEWEWIR